MNITLERARSPAYPTLSPLAQDTLRVIAILSMVMDHVNRVFLQNQIEVFTWAGRLAFPLFALLMAHNLVDRGVPWKRYIVPLLITGFVAQLPFMAVINPNLNVMFTLLLGVLCQPFSDWLERLMGKGSGLFAWILLSAVGLAMDFPLFGVWMIPLASIIMRRKTWLAWIPFLAFCLITNIFDVHAAITLSLPLIVLAVSKLEGVRFNVPRVAWYAFYPIHLFILAVLKHL